MKRNDRGATAIFLALVLLLLIAVSAVALDLARGWNERRQNQTVADIAAVAGALSYDTDQTTIADQVMDSARQNVTNSYSDSDWDNLWSSCVGPPPPGFVALTHSSLGTIDCIGINPSYLWVRLPEQTIDTTFARAIGFDTISTDAEATVTLLGDSGTGALPFAVRGNASSGEVCLDTGTGQIEPPCDGNESGSFGNIAPPLFGNQPLGTSPSCSNQTSANNYVPESIAMGMDHTIWAFSQSAWSATGWDPSSNTSNNSVDGVANMDECNDVGGALAEPADGVPINAVYVDTGNSTKADVTEGLMTGTGFADGGAARLTRSSNTRVVKGIALDNTALWQHLLEDTSHGIDDCDGSDIRGMGTIEERNDAMRGCLEEYETSGSSAQIFANSILGTPRLGIAPRLWHNNLGSGLSYRPVKSFEVVYIHGLWFKDGGDLVAFFPDDGISPFSDGSLPIEQVTAYLLHPDMVSDTVHESLGGFSNDTWQPEIYQ